MEPPEGIFTQRRRILIEYVEHMTDAARAQRAFLHACKMTSTLADLLVLEHALELSHPGDADFEPETPAAPEGSKP